MGKPYSIDLRERVVARVMVAVSNRVPWRLRALVVRWPYGDVDATGLPDFT
jgi:hypothetical protein